MEKPSLCPTLFLNDQPSESDLFGGAHERLAQAIAEIIIHKDDNKTEDAEGGKTIGLEGGWGSGKSTVIRLLCKILDNSENGKNILVCNFDAWAHEGDPLRRTFLEYLIDQFVQIKWVEKEGKKGWENKKSILIGKTSESTVDTSPYLTNLGKWLILLTVILIPFGTALVNKGLSIGLFLGKGLALNYYFWLGFICIIFPFLLLKFSQVAKNNNWSRIIKYFELDKTDDPWSILIQKFKTTTTTHTTQIPNPTSVEFEYYFKLLIREALKDPKHEIVLILDNLDRIFTNDALSILSTLQTFLQCKDQNDFDFDRLWVIIPYDRKGFSRLWEKDDSVTKSMIEKRFQIRFQVPPLVLSNWKDYFISQLTKAFPKHSKGDFYQCYWVYYQAIVREGYPTPRDMKLFINQIGAIHRQWNTDSIPLAHIAYYVLLQRKNDGIKDISQKIVKGDIPEKGTENYLGETIKDDLVAMIFNVEVKIAQQLLLAQPIQAALLNDDVEKLNELHLGYPAGFWAVLESVIGGDWDAAGIKGLAHSASCLYNSNLLFNVEPEFGAMIINSLQKRMSLFNPNEIDEIIGKGIVDALKMNNSDIFFSNVFQSISSKEIDIGLSTKQPKKDVLDPLEKHAIEISQGIFVILDYLAGRSFPIETIHGKIKIASETFGYIEFCAALFKSDPNKKYWKCFSFSISPTVDLNTGFKWLIENNLFSDRHNGSIIVLQNDPTKVDWSIVCGQIKERLVQQSIPFIHELLEALWVLSSMSPRAISQPAKDTLLLLARAQGFVLNHLLNALQSQDSQAVAWSVFIYLQFINKTISNPQVVYASGEGFRRLNEILDNPDKYKPVIDYLIEIMKQYQAMDSWLKIVKEEPKLEKCTKILITKLINERDITDLFSSDVIIANSGVILDILGEYQHWDKFIQEAVSKLCLIDKLLTKDFSVSLGFLYSSIVRNISNKRSDLNNWLVNGLKSIDKKKWIEELNDECNCIELVLDLISIGIPLDLKTPFQDALFEHASGVTEGEITPKYLYDRWNQLSLALTLTDRKVLRKRLLDLLKNATTIHPDFFVLYGSEISDPDLIKQDQDILRKVFSPMLVDERNKEGLSWLSKLLEKNPNLFGKYSQQEDLEDLKSRIIKEANSDTKDDSSPIFIHLAKQLKIKLN
jgi:hypothetical protein